MSQRRLIFLLIFLSLSKIIAQPQQHDRWLQKTGYGLMFHYEAFKNHSTQSYNRAVDSFDVEKFASEVESTGAGHVIFVIGQHWGKYCAPNKAYEKLLGVPNGIWTSKRDLIMEIAQ